MKRTIKKILPILLSLVVICSIAWYLMVYDRGFTQDVLLSSARFFESQGNHNIATWLYNQAYMQSDNDDSVIIELAERFKKIGNYTKAEVVLTSAIAEGGSPELYIALSRTYVEQNKLMDAANMLKNITNPELKAQLDAMRPAAPVATPAPGFYSQYINVTISSDHSAQLYIATDGDFPSVENVYKESITLVGGENKIYAIAVDEKGLVSVPAYFGYTVGGVIEEVTISDPVLDALFRQTLNVGPETQLFTNDLWQITSLVLPEGVTNYSDLSRLAYLETLVINGSGIDNLQVLSPMTQLKTLMISNCPLSATDLNVIGALPNLENLTLSNCSLSNIAGLASATRLLSLDLSGNAIRDLGGLSSMGNLSSLNLSGNALTNLNSLSTLEKLSFLDVSYNSLTSLAPLASCKALSMLIANNNQISEIPAFTDTSVLTVLEMSNNSLTDVAPLSSYTSLSELSLAYNQITDVSPLASLKNLTIVNFSNNKITALPSWPANCLLVELDGSHNNITSVEPLSGLACLNNVYLDYNKISNVNALTKCYMLVRVSVYGNPVKDVSKLKDLSIIVNYDPT